MKVLLIDNYFYRRGGAEVVFLNTGELLKSKGHNVVYFSQQWKENNNCPEEKYFPQGVDVRTNGILNKIRGVIKYFSNKDAAKKIEKLIINEKPDIAHLHLFWGGITGSIFNILKKYHIPIVHTVHDYRMICPGYALKNGNNEICEQCIGGNFYQCVKNKCSKGRIALSVFMCMEMYYRNYLMNPLNNIDSFMFVSDFSHEKHIQFEPMYKDKHCVTMYNFQDDRVLGHVDRNLDTYKSYYLYYGRLSFEKGISTLIMAVYNLPNIKLKIVGTGPLEDTLKQLCLDNGITNVEFLGYKTGDELFEIIKNAKFVCVPSEWYENNPMTIIESYTLRVPVIGAAIGGINEIIKDAETGYKFQPFNSEEIKKVIIKAEGLSHLEYCKLKDCAENFANANFGKENYYSKLMELYEHTIINYNKRN